MRDEARGIDIIGRGEKEEDCRNLSFSKISIQTDSQIQVSQVKSSNLAERISSKHSVRKIPWEIVWSNSQWIIHLRSLQGNPCLETASPNSQPIGTKNPLV